MNTTSLKIACRYLRSKNVSRGFLSVIATFSFLGITIGVAALIIVLSVMSGFHEDLMTRMLDFNSHVSVMSKTHQINDYQPMVDKIRLNPNTQMAMPVLEEQAMVMTDERAAGVMVRGVLKSDLDHKPIIADHMIQGSLNYFEGANPVVVIGRTLALKMGLQVGDTLRLVSPQGNPSPFGLAPRYKTYEVIGIFDAGMSQFNASFVFIPLESAQLFFNMGRSVNLIEVFLKDMDGLPAYKAFLKSQIPPYTYALDWQEANGSFFQAITVERNVMFLILTLITLIATFNIASGLVMLVKDKTSAIGILRAIGASRRFILSIFLTVGAAVGIIGTGLGVLLGVLFVKNIRSIQAGVDCLFNTQVFSEEIYFLTQMPAKLNIEEVLLVSGMSLTLTFLATIYPALSASRMNPVEALHR